MAHILGSTPIFCVDSVPKSLAYYRDVFGFRVGWRWSGAKQRFLEEGETGEPTTAAVARDSLRLFFVEQAQGEPGMWLHLDVQKSDEVDELHQEWEAKGARIVEAPANRPWGNYEMRVADPDGHTFRVASPAKRSA